MVDEQDEEVDRDEVPSEDVDWIIVVFPELGPGVRSVVPYVDPFDQEFRQAGLGRVVEFGTYKNRTQWCIDIEVRRNDVPLAIEAARRVLRSQDFPATAFIRHLGEDLPTPPGA